MSRLRVARIDLVEFETTDLQRLQEVAFKLTLKMQVAETFVPPSAPPSCFSD